MRIDARFLGLTVIAFFTGIAILPVFARCTDKASLELAKRKIRAALYTFRLFGDDPRMVLRAQGQLLLWNARYLAQVLKPAAIVLLPILFLLLQLDAIYGHRALRPDEPAIVTARMSESYDMTASQPTLSGNGATVDTPPLRIPATHQILWRVHAEHPGKYRLLLHLPESAPDRTIQKTLQAGPGLHYLSLRRVAHFWSHLEYPAEPRLASANPVLWIGVAYPDAVIHIFGYGIPWIVWFVLVSWASMFAFRRRFGVVL